MGLFSQGFRASLGKCSYTLVSEDKADMQSSLEEQRKRQKSLVSHPLSGQTEVQGGCFRETFTFSVQRAATEAF